MDLHSDKEIFKELIALAADHFGYEQSHIEKDYWVCKILKEIALSEYKEKVFFNIFIKSLWLDRTLFGRFGFVRFYRKYSSIQTSGKNIE